MSLEIEATFSSPKGELMMIAWFEGSSAARLVLTGPSGEREEVQINSIDASLGEDVKGVLAESFPPGAEGGVLTAKIKVANDRARVGRSVKLGGFNSNAERMCAKLVAMADLLAKDAAIKRTIGVIRKHLHG